MSDRSPSASERQFSQSLIPQVQALVSSRIRIDCVGRAVTTFAIGGTLRALVTLESHDEAVAVISLLYRENQPFRVLGNGSNVLISDAGIAEWVLKLGAGLRSWRTLESGAFEVSGAASLMAFARKVSDLGLGGLEFAAGIPASLGGAVYMNAGAHGFEMENVVESVQGVLPNGTSVIWNHDELPWSYRNSGLPVNVVITSATLRLHPGNPEEIAQACAHNLRERRLRQPLALPSAGSVFKNPSPQNPAGRVLELAGVKGRSVGGAQVSELHANWIVNPAKNAKASDVVALIELCQMAARETQGIDLHPEVRVWGEC